MDELECLLADQGRALHALLLRLTQRHDTAEDLMQELFLQLARSKGFSTAANRTAYAFQVAINLAMTWRRKERTHRLTLQPVATPISDPTDPLQHAIQSDLLQCILDHLENLAETDRQIVVRRYIQQEPYETIAATLGKTAHQVRALCHKAIERLRTAMTENEVHHASD